MYWKTKKILEEARTEINDEGVFSRDQIVALHRMLKRIGEAIESESDWISSSIKHDC